MDISSITMQCIVPNVLFLPRNCWIEIEIVLFQHKLRFWAAQLRGTYSELWWVSTSIQSVFQWSLLMFINTVSWFTSYTIAIFFNLIDVTLNKTKFISSLWKCQVIFFWILNLSPFRNGPWALLDQWHWPRGGEQVGFFVSISNTLLTARLWPRRTRFP